MTTIQNIKDIAECFLGCHIHSCTRSLAVVYAPDADQADGVFTMLQRNAIRSRVQKSNFSTNYYVLVPYG